MGTREPTQSTQLYTRLVQHTHTTQPSLDMHTIILCFYCDSTGIPVDAGRVLFIRFPPRQRGITAHDILFTFSQIGPVAYVAPADNQGGFVITLGGEVALAQHTARLLIEQFHGKANLNGEELVQELMPI